MIIDTDEISPHEDFETIGKKLTETLQKYSDEGYGIKKVIIEIGELTQIEMYKINGGLNAKS